MNSDLCLGNQEPKFPLVSLAFPLEKKGTMLKSSLRSPCDLLELVVPLPDKKGPSPPPMGSIRALAPPQLLSTVSLKVAGRPIALRAARSRVLEMYRK